VSNFSRSRCPVTTSHHDFGAVDTAVRAATLHVGSRCSGWLQFGGFGVDRQLAFPDFGTLVVLANPHLDDLEVDDLDDLTDGSVRAVELRPVVGAAPTMADRAITPCPDAASQAASAPSPVL
jgi:hypothetical protein